ACARIGAIHSVVYAGMGAGALRNRIEDCKAKAVVAADFGFRRGKRVELLPTLETAVRGLAFVERVILHRRVPETPLPKGWVDFAELAEGRPGTCEPERMDAEDPLFILYTSGTTGKPKGVVHAQGGFMVGTYYLSRMFYDIHEEDVYWSTSDIGWIVGHSYIVYGPLFAGATVLVREGAPDYPDPGAVWRAVERHGVNLMFTAPTTLRMFMKLGEEWLRKFDLSSLRVVAVAGEPLNPEAWSWAQKHIVGPHGGYVIDNYWQTEVASPMIGTFASLPFRPGKVGVPMPGVVLDVVDRAGEPVEAGKGGTLVMREPAPYMLRTIYGDDPRYASLWGTIPGVYYTGDIAVRDKDGYIAVLGRDDDVIKVAGHRLGTAEIESSLIEHPAVAEAAAIGLPDPVKGERIKCFVVLRGGAGEGEALSRELIRHVRQDLGPVAVVSEVVFTDKLPKTRSGKIVRRFLKARE
ncbi:MAG: AMP-binding protein, partial [Candidatus Methylomirabilis sp.]|nr:AMP-binding protein [Deltaproteobacteria bacterium]